MGQQLLPHEFPFLMRRDHRMQHQWGVYNSNSGPVALRLAPYFCLFSLLLSLGVYPLPSVSSP